MKSLLLALMLLAAPAFAEFVVPATPNPVNDYAGVLTAAGKETIAYKIVQLKRATGAQAGVLIVKTLDGSSLEESSMQVARKWKLGSASKDDGILVFLAINDHKMRIEVGQGLEGIVTDYKARQITTKMKPYLRSANYDDAVIYAIGEITNTIVTHSDEITTKPTKTGAGVGFGWLLGLGALVAGLFGFFVYRSIKEDQRREKEAREAGERRQREYERLAEEARQREANTNPLTAAEQAGLATLMYADLKKEVAKTPLKAEAKSDDEEAKRRAKKRKQEEEEEEERRARRRREEESSSSSYSSSYSSSSSYDSGSSSSDSGSSWGGGGGDFSGGGSSDSW